MITTLDEEWIDIARLIDDPAFVPCRDERCDVPELHAEHAVCVKRGRQIHFCPVCGSPIVRVPRKWTHCSKCSWRIIKPKETERARNQP
jgi:hypothetical protein